MRNILYSLFATLGILLLSGCTYDPKSEIPNSLGGETPYRVRFTLSGRSLLRASGDETQVDQVKALDREKKINSLYAVLFKAGDGAFYKTVPCTPVAGETDVYEFDALRVEKFFFYLVANPSTTLIDQLEDKVETKESLAELKANQTPGEDATADSFLMVSDQHTVTTSANSTVTLATSPVKLTRLSVRYDFYNEVPDLVISKITALKRYTESHLYAQVDKMAQLAFESNKEYAVNIVGSSDPSELTARECASIYSYENDTRSETTFLVEATHKGKPLDPITVSLEGMNVKRNYIYEIHFRAVPDPTVEDPEKIRVNFEIEVVDWSQGEKIDANIELPNQKPNWVGYSAELPYATYMTSSLRENPTPLRTLSNEAVTIRVAVHTYGEPGTISYADSQPKGASRLVEVPNGVSQDPMTGRFTKWYTFSIPAKPDGEAKIKINDTDGKEPVLPGSGKVTNRKREITYTWWNLVAKTADGKYQKPIPVAHGRLRMVLENVAEYDLAPIPGINLPEPHEHYYKGATPVDYRAKLGEIDFTDPSIYRMATSHNWNEVGYFPMTESLIKTLRKGVVIGGKKYHLAETQYELNGIFPGTQARKEKPITAIGKNAPARYQQEESLNLSPSFYVDRKSEYQIFDISTTGDFRTPPSKGGRVSYAVRFQELGGVGNWQMYNEALVTAFRYEWVGSLENNSTNSKLVVTCRPLGENWIEPIDGTVATEEFWKKDTNMDVTREFLLTGCFVGQEEFTWAYGNSDLRHISRTYEDLGLGLKYPAKAHREAKAIYSHADSTRGEFDGYKPTEYYVEGTRVSWFDGCGHTIFGGPILLKTHESGREAMCKACHGRLYPLRLFLSE